MRLPNFFKVTLGTLTLSGSLVITSIPAKAQLEQNDQFRLNAPGLSCEGIGEPLSKEQIRQRKPKNANPSKDITALFEQFVINIAVGDPGTSLKKNIAEQGGKRYPSEFRRKKAKKQNVEPDLVGSVFVLVLINGRPSETLEYKESFFIDAKLVESSTTQPVKFGRSYSRYQLSGFIDVLKDSAAGVSLRTQPPERAATPVLSIVSSREGRIQPNLVKFANDNKVSLRQSIACNNADGTPGKDDLQIGKSVLINPELAVSLGDRPIEPIDFTLIGTSAGTLPTDAEPGVGN
ncbi:MAG: hypothetical protein AAF063_16535 [Cyanobacteria bacterium J06643_5]